MALTRQLTEAVHLRMISVDDAADLSRAYVENRAHLAPWEPLRPESFFTEEGQRRVIPRLLEEQERGVTEPYVLVDERSDSAREPGTSSRIVGRVTLSGIERGPFQSARLGYWMARSHAHRGIMASAVATVIEIARDELGLHRLEAATLVRNEASQRVLLRNGFVQFGVAPQYLRIAGDWQDHRLFQRILHMWAAPAHVGRPRTRRGAACARHRRSRWPALDSKRR